MNFMKIDLYIYSKNYPDLVHIHARSVIDELFTHEYHGTIVYG